MWRIANLTLSLWEWRKEKEKETYKTAWLHFIYIVQRRTIFLEAEGVKQEKKGEGIGDAEKRYRWGFF